MNRKIKTISAALLAAAMCAVFAGCANNEEPTGGSKTSGINESNSDSRSESSSGGGETPISGTPTESAKIPDTPIEELPLVPPVGKVIDDQTQLNIIMINDTPIDLLTVNPKEFCKLASNFYMQIDDNYVNTKKYENKAGFLFNGVPVAQGFNASAPVFIETLDAEGKLLTEWRPDTDPDNPLPYDDYEIKGIHYDFLISRRLNISFAGGTLDVGISREDAEKTLGKGLEQHLERKITDRYTDEETTEYTNLVYYKNTAMSMVLEYEEYDGMERLMGITLIKNVDKHDQ